MAWSAKNPVDAAPGNGPPGPGGRAGAVLGGIYPAGPGGAAAAAAAAAAEAPPPPRKKARHADDDGHGNGGGGERK